MPGKIILLADNDPDFRSTRAEFLEREGYQILLASSPSESERLLRDVRLHLAILDVRLTNDDDDKDISGLNIASNHAYSNIPKIILTGFGGVKIARSVLKQSNSFTPAINYIEKSEGPDALIQAVREAFAEHIKIHWDLSINWKARDSFSVARLIEPNLEGARLLDRAEELEDLFRRLFYEKEHIRLDRLLWNCNGRVAMVVLAFEEGAKQESFVVVCGKNDIVYEEALRFEQFAPKAPGETGTMLSKKAETTHFAANAYTLAGNDLEEVQTLSELYRSVQEKVFKNILTSLFQNTLHRWHQGKPIAKKNTSLKTLYRQLLELSDEYFSHVNLDEHIKVIESQIATIGSKIVRKDNMLTFHFGDQFFSFPDPLLVFSKTPDQNEMLLAINVPGILTGENILSDESGRAWLTDFADAGLAPLLWNFVALEAAIRFDWVEMNDLHRRYEMENCLINTDFAKPDTRDLVPNTSKPVRAITVIRKLASYVVGKDTQAYHLGIFFHAMHRFVEFDPALPLTSRDLVRLGQILLSMAMIAGMFEQSKADKQENTLTTVAEIRIVDRRARIVLIGNRKEHLAPQPFEILQHLFNHANEVCTKDELLTDALKGNYEESYLHTLIGRIRKVIEDDPEHPRFLITEPNTGYRLISKPE